MCVGIMEDSFTTNSVIGYHIKQMKGDAQFGKVLYYEQEIGSRNDTCACSGSEKPSAILGGALLL